MPRIDGRQADQLREVHLTTGVNPYAEGSALVDWGQTRVLCTASLEEGVPRFLDGEGKGWVTAEYAMLPRSTHTRTGREHSKKGRAREISRLIGRSLRAAVDLADLEGYTIRLDCDVLVADGGTRVASITGGWLALALAMKTLGKAPARQIAALSLGRVDGTLVADLCYAEDSNAELDLNLVFTADGSLVEVQATGEDGTFTPAELAQLVGLGGQAAQTLFAAQAAALAAA